MFPGAMGDTKLEPVPRCCANSFAPSLRPELATSTSHCSRCWVASAAYLYLATAWRMVRGAGNMLPKQWR